MNSKKTNCLLKVIYYCWNSYSGYFLYTLKLSVNGGCAGQRHVLYFDKGYLPWGESFECKYFLSLCNGIWHMQEPCPFLCHSCLFSLLTEQSCSLFHTMWCKTMCAACFASGYSFPFSPCPLGCPLNISCSATMCMENLAYPEKEQLQ